MVFFDRGTLIVIHTDTCFWYPNTNVVFGIRKERYFSIWRSLREGLGGTLKPQKRRHIENMRHFGI
jgi:hypothetical protein